MAPTPDTNDSLLLELRGLGERVRQARLQQGLTLQALATRADIGLQTLIRIEDGNPGVSALNLNKALAALGLSLGVQSDQGSRPGVLPCHLLHVDSPEVQEAVEDAARAACDALSAVLPSNRPEVDGISSNFQGLLVEHLRQMLCGNAGVPAHRAPALRALVFSDALVGGPTQAPAECEGWALRVKGSPRALQDGREVLLSAEVFDPWCSRGDALTGLRDMLAQLDGLEGPVEAVPVYWSDALGYHY